jgi:GxGYxY sequence motif in domain of unknown function N-terminal/GxGYxYP putative glycoside hydrolase C-terminal domain
MNMNKALRFGLLTLAVTLLCPLPGRSQSSNVSSGKSFYCVDARKLGFPQRLLLDSLQALANSNASALFVMQRTEDASWLAAMEKQLGKTFDTISADEALDRFGANASQVIYDSGQHWNLSIATTLAGLHRALLTDQKLDGHEIAFDCRNRWTNKLEAYRWALTELLPQCHRSQLIYLDEGLSFLRDYAMQQKLFVLNLDPLNDPQEIKLLDEILGKFPAQTRVFGWASGAYARKAKGQNDVTVEVALVRRLSQRGMMLVPADFASNLSFYTQTGPYVGKLAQQRLHRDFKFQTGKRYVLLVVSDGDNLQYDLGAMRAQWEKERPQVPVAWSISPQLAEAGPAVLQTYYQEAAARGGWDEFVAGPSGYAYVNPGSMTTTRLAAFIGSTRRACQKADIKSIVIVDDSSRPPTQVAGFINAYASAKFDGLWLAAMPRYVGAMKGTAFLNERFRLGRNNPAEVAQQVKQVKTDSPFVMIYVNEWEKVGDVIRDFVQGLDDSCVLVSPTEMADLIRQCPSLNAAMRQIAARPDAAEGLTPVRSGDGELTIVERDGVRCWLVPKRTSPNYFYLHADDGFRGSPLEIELEYLDAGNGEIALDYDSADIRAPVGGAYKRHASVVRRANSAQWLVARFRVNDARFIDSQNSQADFRFYNGGDDLLIRAVRVRRVAP